ncbi:hypothetical protein KFL_000140180 [Klebsormidium nitens]|uniref:Uncharacterized protein n=1 Tax=Klebsormidium nitens TaxID=105231 RepID=A0A1Y1HMT6_KLENI|nr:hypothetical protein KFL_000140180 [Klebsormidium nitens]|eukprot:GAQ78499.1 hypothetical protein KFL_000140180 [Klebsormidium nitens]
MLTQHELGKKHAKAAARAVREKNAAPIGGVDCTAHLGANVGMEAGAKGKGLEEGVTASDEEQTDGPGIIDPFPGKNGPIWRVPHAGCLLSKGVSEKEDSPKEVGTASIPLQAPPNSINHRSTPDPASKPTTIVMDALNWLDKFWNLFSARRDPWRELGAMEERVMSFAKAARASGLALVAVIDAATKTAEAQAKWRLRRNKEIRQEDKHMVLGIDGFFSDVLETAGIRVIRPLDADADDVIAALAAAGAPGSCVLSKDSDFFRYIPRVRVCNNWGIVHGKLRLAFAAPGSTSRAHTREIDFTLAKWAGQSVGDGGCKLNPSLRGGEICRGTSSSSDKRMGNLHGITRPLRAAVYARLGERSAVEKWPEWDETSGIVLWQERELEADASLDGLLDDPGKVVAWIEEQDGSFVGERWRKVERAFNRCAIAAELCSAASRGSKRPLELQRLFTERKFCIGQ